MNYDDPDEEADLQGDRSSTEVSPPRGATGEEVHPMRDPSMDNGKLSAAAKALARAETEIASGFTKEAIALALISIAHSLLPDDQQDARARYARDMLARRRIRH